METARFVRSRHSMGTSMLVIALSAWMSASSFAGSPQSAFTLTRNVAAPAFVLSPSSSIASRKMSASGAPTNVAFALSSTHLYTAFSRAWLTNKAWSLSSQGCHVMPRQRPLFPDSSSWILSLLPSPPPSAGLHNLFPFAPFLVRSITHCDCASGAVIH